MTTDSTYERAVTTQAELDQAIADGVKHIEIRSERGVWLEVGGSASVSAFGLASVRAFGSASVRAFDSASVRAFGSASVRAFDSASVRAFGSASVRASGSASVRAFDSASVSASSHVAVHLHSGHATVDGGVLIDHTEIDLTDPAIWCTYHGVKVDDNGIATVYKAVNDQWTTDRGFDYSPGSTTEAPDWHADNSCGRGLHFGPTPMHAQEYHREATRYVAVGVRMDELRPIADGGMAKCKAPRTVVAAVEVDVHGRVVETTVA